MPVKNNVITGMAANNAKMPHIASVDIGKFAALAFPETLTFEQYLMWKGWDKKL